jgi:hypothetical protein
MTHPLQHKTRQGYSTTGKKVDCIIKWRFIPFPVNQSGNLPG